MGKSPPCLSYGQYTDQREGVLFKRGAKVGSSGSFQVEASGGHVGGAESIWLVLAGASSLGGEGRGSAQTSAP